LEDVIRNLFALLCASVLLHTPSLSAADTLTVLRGDGAAPIRLAPGQNITLTSETDINEVASSRPATADLRHLTIDTLSLTGGKPGRATILSLGDADEIMLSEVLVSPDGQLAESAVALQTSPQQTTVSIENGAGQSPVWVAENGAIVVALDQPVNRIEVRDSAVAMGVLLWPSGSSRPESVVYLLGMQEGQTELILLKDGGPVRVQIDVVPNMTGLE